MVVRETISFNNKEPLIMPCAQNSGLYNVKVGGDYNNHSCLNG
jgi:hypothetical protein